jgi:TRAP transporter TAXI family solute receptor
MKTKTVLSIVAAVAIGIFALASHAADYTYVNIGTAGIGGGYYPAGGAICNMVNKTRKDLNHNIRCTVEATAGSVANLRAIRAGDLDIAFSQSDWQYHAYSGTSRFQEDGPNKELRFMFSLQFDAFHFVVHPKLKDVKSIQDLKGKVVNTGNVGSGHESTLKMLFADYYKLDPSAFFAQEGKLTSREQAQALCDGKLDAFLFPCGIGMTSPTEAAATCKARIIPWFDNAIQKVLAEKPYFGVNIIPAGAYEGQTEAVKTWGVGTTLVTTTRMPEDIIYKITKSVFDNWDVFQAQSPVFVGVTREGAAKTFQSAPYHPGAAKYFKEVGLLK